MNALCDIGISIVFIKKKWNLLALEQNWEDNSKTPYFVDVVHAEKQFLWNNLISFYGFVYRVFSKIIKDLK